MFGDSPFSQASPQTGLEGVAGVGMLAGDSAQFPFRFGVEWPGKDH